MAQCKECADALHSCDECINTFLTLAHYLFDPRQFSLFPLSVSLRDFSLPIL